MLTETIIWIIFTVGAVMFAGGAGIGLSSSAIRSLSSNKTFRTGVAIMSFGGFLLLLCLSLTTLAFWKIIIIQ